MITEAPSTNSLHTLHHTVEKETSEYTVKGLKNTTAAIVDILDVHGIFSITIHSYYPTRPQVSALRVKEHLRTFFADERICFPRKGRL